MSDECLGRSTVGNKRININRLRLLITNFISVATFNPSKNNAGEKLLPHFIDETTNRHRLPVSKILYSFHYNSASV